MAKSKASKAKKNAAKSSGLVTSNSINSKKKMYPETSMVCDFFCRYLINSNMFTLEQILNFKTNLRNVLLKKYKQFTWDKKQPLKGNASRSILVFKSTLDPVLVVAGYKAGILKMDEKDVNLKKSTSISNATNVAVITPSSTPNEDSSDEDSQGLGNLDISPSLMAIRTTTSEKGKIPISYEKFKNIFLTNGEIVLWCDPGIVSYTLDDGQIVTIYDKEKEKAEQAQHKKANKKGNSPNIKKSSLNRSPSVISRSSSLNSKKSPVVSPTATSPNSKKDKKKNKKKDKKDDKQKNSPNIKKENKQSNGCTSPISILKNIALENSPLILPAPINIENQSVISTNSYSPELSEIPLFNGRRDSLLSAIPNNNVLINKSSNNFNYNLNNVIGAPFVNNSGINCNFSENNHPFVNLLSRSVVMV